MSLEACAQSELRPPMKTQPADSDYGEVARLLDYLSISDNQSGWNPHRSQISNDDDHAPEDEMWKTERQRALHESYGEVEHLIQYLAPPATIACVLDQSFFRTASEGSTEGFSIQCDWRGWSSPASPTTPAPPSLDNHEEHDAVREQRNPLEVEYTERFLAADLRRRVHLTCQPENNTPSSTWLSWGRGGASCPESLLGELDSPELSAASQDHLKAACFPGLPSLWPATVCEWTLAELTGPLAGIADNRLAHTARARHSVSCRKLSVDWRLESLP